MEDIAIGTWNMEHGSEWTPKCSRDLSYEVRLKECCLTILETRRLTGDQNKC